MAANLDVRKHDADVLNEMHALMLEMRELNALIEKAHLLASEHAARLRQIVEKRNGLAERFCKLAQQSIYG